MEITVWQVFLVALLTDLATGLGAVPFFFVKEMSARWQGIMGGFAGGMMISAAVFSLADKAITRGTVWQVIAGMLAGAAFFAWTAHKAEQNEYQIESLGPEASHKSALLIIVMFIHSIPEGVAIGVGYATGELQFGLLLALAIAFHNVPEGVAVSLPLRAKGVSAWKCVGYAILTSVPQPLAAVPAYMAVSWAKYLLAPGLGFAGGAMIFIVIADLLPDCLARCSKNEAAWSVVVGLVVMLAITAGIGL